MRRPYLIALLCLAALSFSCKKYIRQQEEKAIMSIITSGYWHVEQYSQNDSDITASFSGYLFKFDADGTVTGMLNWFHFTISSIFTLYFFEMA